MRVGGESSTVEEHDVAWNALDGLDEKGRQVGVLAFLARLGLVVHKSKVSANEMSFLPCVVSCRACGGAPHLFDELEKLGYLLLTPLDGGQRVVVVVDVPRVELKKGCKCERVRLAKPNAHVSCVVCGVCGQSDGSL